MYVVSQCESMVEIGNVLIGKDEPICISAEVGTTANGDIYTALKLIEVAKQSGMNLVKFQFIDCDDFMRDKDTEEYEYETADGPKKENMYQMLKKLQFTPDEWRKIAKHCRKNDIPFCLSVDSIRSVVVGEGLGVAAYKIGSWDLRNYPLIKAIALTDKPIMIDLGPAILGEVVNVINEIEKDNDQIILVHCSHAKDEGINMRTIPYIHETFEIPVGYSADTRDIVPDIMAVGMGVNLIEKRLTLNIEDSGHHHIKAMEPLEMIRYVETIRRAEKMIGEYEIRPSLEDLGIKNKYFTSLVADTDIPKGTIITPDMLAARRPGNGVSPFYQDRFYGRNATRDIKKNEDVVWGDAE